jgi:hypothetical protein
MSPRYITSIYQCNISVRFFSSEGSLAEDFSLLCQARRMVPQRHRGITLTKVSFRPGALEGVQTSPTGGQVEYLLARNAVIREYKKGRLSRLDVCDAHPELLRAASNLGRPSGERCPICEEGDLVDVTFVFGARLPSGGRCVSTQAELARYWRRKDPVVCYVIEVCSTCRWNHLSKMYPAGAGVEAVARKPLGSRASSQPRP